MMKFYCIPFSFLCSSYFFTSSSSSLNACDALNLVYIWLLFLICCINASLAAPIGYSTNTYALHKPPSLTSFWYFDCAFKAVNGTRSIHYMGHIKMMGAVQPFLSGAISKTVNLPEDATIEDIE